MKVFVLGHNGMLGHVVGRLFREKGLQVITSDFRYTGEPADPLITAVSESDASWVVNCIGKIKQKSQEKADLYLTNGILPIHLKSFLKPDQRLIHASTDCVFSGKRGLYRTTDLRDADDSYGLSKIIGESVGDHPRCMVMRTSIIGPEISSPRGLMGWFLNQKSAVRGFTNHMWNGITTLEWAQAALQVIVGQQDFRSGIIQIGSAQPVSKCELLRLISEKWPHKVEIIPVAAPEAINRTLTPDLIRSTLDCQLAELSKWYRGHDS